jgi:ketosteroid isomerase-like protein
MASTEEVTSFEPREFFSDDGGNVVVLGAESCRSKLTGKEMKSGWSMVFRIRDGKVAAWEIYYDTLAYHAAHQK